MPHDVFINHSTAGKLTAYAICSELESIGIRCWILPRDLNIGIGWDQSIANAIKCCRLMIVVLSDYASRSDRVERQLELAFNHNVIVVPFKTEPEWILTDDQAPADPVHWLDVVTPEMAHRLRSLCAVVGGLILRQKSESLPILSLPDRGENAPSVSDHVFADLPRRELEEAQTLEPAKIAAELPDGGSGNEAVAVLEPIAANESLGNRTPHKPSEKNSKWLLAKALVLTLVPFAVICAIGFKRSQSGSGPVGPKPTATASASVAPPVVVKVQHLDKFAATSPGWGTLDANWTVADDKLQVTPLLNSSAVLINHKLGFADAEISVEIVMSKGEDLDQLGGLIFWAKDYNDCYALVISADGKFALGRKLIGRWINPIAKTGNAAVKTGIGQTNKLRVRTEGSLLTAFINDVQVASITGEPPQGLSYVGLYGESGETTQNIWEFANITISSMR
jgi:TIR domain-containing protein